MGPARSRPRSGRQASKLMPWWAPLRTRPFRRRGALACSRRLLRSEEALDAGQRADRVVGAVAELVANHVNGLVAPEGLEHAVGAWRHGGEGGRDPVGREWTHTE